MLTPCNKKVVKKQRNPSISEDLENTESHKITKVCKELLEDIETVKEGYKNLSPRKKLSDIVNNSGMVGEEICKRNFMEATCNPKPGCSKDVEKDELKHFKLKPFSMSLDINNSEGAKLEPVKKRWLREAYQDSSKWEYNFIQPISWEEESPERVVISESDSHIHNRKILNENNTSVRYYESVSQFEVHSNITENSLNSITINRFGNMLKVNNFDETIAYQRIRVCDNNNQSNSEQIQASDPHTFNFKNSFDSQYGYNLSVSNEGQKLNEIRPTVLMHSGQCKQLTKQQNYRILEGNSFLNKPDFIQTFENNNFKEFIDLNNGSSSAQNSSIKRPLVIQDSTSKGKVPKLAEDSDISTALLLMELSKSPSSGYNT